MPLIGERVCDVIYEIHYVFECPLFTLYSNVIFVCAVYI